MSNSSIIVNEEVLTKIIRIGIALSATTDPKDLLKLITMEARELTFSDSASLYLVKDNHLSFVVSQCASLDGISGNTISRRIFKESLLPISSDSIVGHVARTKQIELLDDAYSIPADKPYRHNNSFDEENDYRTQSMVTVPMIDVNRNVIGVLQLINHLDPSGNIISYPTAVLPLLKALASQAAVAVVNAQMQEELKSVQYDTIVRLSTAAEFRDNETAKHVERVSRYSRTIAEYLDLSSYQQEIIAIASPMHDIGKIGIPDKILLKPGRFTPEERTIMETHSNIGGRIMKGGGSGLIRTCREIALTHHEKFDGSGYPFGLKKDDIPITGRIVAVADVFDAICSKRCYKDAVPFDDVLDIVRKEDGAHFDPKCIKAFFRALPTIRQIHEEWAD